MLTLDDLKGLSQEAIKQRVIDEWSDETAWLSTLYRPHLGLLAMLGVSIGSYNTLIALDKQATVENLRSGRGWFPHCA